MAVTAARIVVTDARARLGAAPAVAERQFERGSAGARLRVRNRGAGSVDIGGNAVATGAGYELAAGQVEDFDLDPGEELHAIGPAASSNRLDVVRFGEAIA